MLHETKRNEQIFVLKTSMADDKRYENQADFIIINDVWPKNYYVCFCTTACSGVLRCN